METVSGMDKKALVRASNVPYKNAQETTVKDYSGKKIGNQNVRKKEFDRPDAGRKPVGMGWSSQRVVRSKEKPGASNQVKEGEGELGSLFHPGGKKQQDITHLLDWWGSSDRGGLRRVGGIRIHSGSGQIRRQSTYMPKYNKEHFLQANCQFIVLDNGDYSAYSADPDLLVEWPLVEEVRMHVSQTPMCPICLHPPTAPKVTRCGHIYCFPCILHYLALSDKKWRKCPICYDAIMKEDLKSVTSVCHKDFNVGDQIEFLLMRRDRDSLVPVPVNRLMHCQPRLLAAGTVASQSKLLLASKDEVLDCILHRELSALTTLFIDEKNQPESCFIEEAIALVHTRKNTLREPRVLEGAASESQEDLTLEETVNLQTQPAMIDKIDNNNETFSAFGETKYSEDFDMSNLHMQQISTHDHAQTHPVPKPTFYFYQASDGGQVFLHAINVQMLVCEFGSLENCPNVIKANVVEKESNLMTEDMRNRLRYLRHLPLHSTFEVVEVDLKEPIVSRPTRAQFHDRLEARRRNRSQRAREERKIEKRIQLEEDRIFGRSNSNDVQVHTGSLKHFPAIADDDVFFSIQGGNDVADGGVCTGMLPAEPITNEFKTTEVKATEMWHPISFAQVAREGSNCLTHSISEPVNLSTSGGAAWGKAPATNCATGVGSDDEGTPVPDFRYAFSDAITKAMESVALKTSCVHSDEDQNGKGKKGRKKKQILLFSSGGLN